MVSIVHSTDKESGGGGIVRYTQYLIFELGSKCNLDKEHWGRCPSGDPDRYGALDTSRELTDSMILQTAEEAHNLGFTGRIGFHYYNEPSTQWDRLLDLKQRIENSIPSQTFVLWTNGLNLHRLEQAPADSKPHFTDIVISNYFKKDWSWVAPYCDRLEIGNGLLDGRKWPIRQDSNTMCLRPFNEMIFDNYGNAHLCCADWQGTSNLGSLHKEPFRDIAVRFLQIRMALVALTVDNTERSSIIPALCARCRIKQIGISGLVPEVSQRISQELFPPKSVECA
jgi:hypothetical protein